MTSQSGTHAALASAIPKSVIWSGGTLRLLDQTRLPHEEIYLVCDNHDAVRKAICNLSVRGAPAIGIAAAYGMVLGKTDLVGDELIKVLTRRANDLVSARPTAVNLAWAVNRMMSVARRLQNEGQVATLAALELEAIAIHAEDAAACRAIGAHGLELVRQSPRLLTHCNAGALAVSELGTALAPVYFAHAEGLPVHVFVDETRPLLQGARLTAYELQRAGVDMTLITDNMAAHVMSQGKVDAVIVGADRVAANGDVANKIGTLNLAILCKYFSLPFYVACPWSTVDRSTPTGEVIVIEERDCNEVVEVQGRAISPKGTPVFNPAFDVTPADLVTAFVTERGIISPPFGINFAALEE